ncbi:hypothetical protein [Actinophytocola gossypii]|uniref:Anti-sigma-D factor RsdA sigma factor binding region domain-containing protein n=1 Tax=Actinophytocola gossypii TaxID=2812003 RepID=A0ABT2J1B9_9PSEU|nr:hypothetical protein [Actinophytocola gossypii]MCT2581653.1 hypothetical protein [Actinophytocola gossypii]
MSVRGPFGDSRWEDDELLDRIGRGEHGDLQAEGEVARMLAGWRAGMPTAGATDERLLNAVTAAVARPPRRRRSTKVTAVAAAAAVLAAGGVTVAAAQARPGSPLWPVTEVVFAGRAESRAAVEDADDVLADARTAVDQGRIPEATRLLDRADEYAAKVDEPAAADRLRDDIESIRDLLRQDSAQTRSHATPQHAPASEATPEPTTEPVETGEPTEKLAPIPDTSIDTPADLPPRSGPELPVDPGTVTDRQRSGKPVDLPGRGEPLDRITRGAPR